tara:strand:+ start:176 stop:598 length:423 start_codon:yes stop_codon:yes gene_type:complete
MRLYTTGYGHWAGTQSDARKISKQEKVECELSDVPVAKPELLSFLNKHKVSLTEHKQEVKEELPKQVSVAEQHEDIKVVGETRHEYLRRWKQEHADWNDEYKCKEAIENVLWDAPLDHLAQFSSILISRINQANKGDNNE